MKYWIVFSNDIERGGTDHIEIHAILNSKKKAIEKILRLVKKQINNCVKNDPTYLKNFIIKNNNIFTELDEDATLADTMKILKKILVRELRGINKCTFLLNEYSFRKIDY